MAETKARKLGQMEVTSDEKSPPTRALDQYHSATCYRRLTLLPNSQPIRLAQVWLMETVAGMEYNRPWRPLSRIMRPSLPRGKLTLIIPTEPPELKVCDLI